MKKILIATNVLLLGIILFQACNSGKQEVRFQATDITDPCDSFFCDDYSNTPLRGVISGEILRELSQRYDSDLCKSFISQKGKTTENGTSWSIGTRKDALSMVFDLEKIKNFIWRMERLVCKSGCDTTTRLGVRFYYIKYPDSSGLSFLSLPKNYRNKHALAMVPVYQDKVSLKWYDFYFTNNENNINRCVFFLPVYDSFKKRYNILGLLDQEGIGDGTNHGGVGPPPEPGTFPTSGN